MAIEFFLASVRLYAVGAKTLELQGPCCGAVFFLRRKAAEEKNGLGQIARTIRIARVAASDATISNTHRPQLRCMRLLFQFILRHMMSSGF